MSYSCEFCPKLCHHACPVGDVSHDEALNTWGKINTLAHIDQKKLPETNYAVAYQCVQCHASETACEIDTPATNILHDYRIKAFKKGLAPQSIQKFIQEFSQIRLYMDSEQSGKSSDVLFVPSFDHNSLEDTSFQKRIQKTQTLFEKLKLTVDFLQSDLPCCGYAYYAAGDEKSFKNHARHQLKFLKKYKTIVSDSAMCLEMLQKYQNLGKVKFLHISEFLLPHIKKTGSQSAAYHDPCYLGRHRKGSGYAAPRELLKRASGHQPQEFRRHHDSSYCCGGGGLFPITSPQLADQMTLNRLEELRKTGLNTLVTACTTCVGRFKNIRDKHKMKIEILDIVDLLTN